MVLCCLFCCQNFDDVSSYVCFHYTFSSVWVADWPPFAKELPIRLVVCSHCILYICNFSYFPFGFKSRVCFLLLLFLFIAYYYLALLLSKTNFSIVDFILLYLSAQIACNCQSFHSSLYLAVFTIPNCV